MKRPHNKMDDNDDSVKTPYPCTAPFGECQMLCPDLELGIETDASTASGSHNAHPVRKRIAIKLKPPGKGGKEKKQGRSKAAKDARDGTLGREGQSVDDLGKSLQFTTMKTVVSSEPLHKSQKLRWDHKVNLIGEKVVDPLIHSCEKCLLPILIYGRLLPCKHVFCFSCAKKTEKSCPRCNLAIARIEQSALGTVFVCTIGGSKHGVSGCHRTYLSQRDLQSHVHHRHLNRSDSRGQEQVVGPMPQSETLLGHTVSPGGIHKTVPGPTPHTMEYIGQPPPSSGHAPIQFGAPMHEPGVVYIHQQQQQIRPMEELRLQMPPPQGMPPQQVIMQPPPHMMKHPSNLQASPHMGMSPHMPAPQGVPQMQGMQQSGLQMIQSHPVSQEHMVGPPQNSNDGFHSIPVMATRSTNLITVPIQDEGDYHSRGQYRDAGPNAMFVQQGGPPPAGHYPPNSQQSMQKPCAVVPPVSFTNPPPGHIPPGFMSQPPPHVLSRPPPGGNQMGPPPPRTGQPQMNLHSGPPPRAYTNPHHQFEEQQQQQQQQQQHQGYGMQQQQGGGSSPRMPPWQPQHGHPPPRGPMPPRPQSGSGNMGPPHSMPFY